MSLVQRYLAFVTHHHLFQKSDHLLIAVSGGADSVVLCELCHQAGYAFSIAHCNFQLRGDESNRDEAFVRSLAEKYNVPLYVQMVDTTAIAKDLKLSIQETARKVRYDWFFEILEGKETKPANEKTPVIPGYILTAHHLDDSIETMLMNFFKGTGIKGLRGIQAKQDKLIRPLLFATRSEIIEFAQSNKLDWVEDSSNIEEKYTRNYFRNTLLPAVEKVFPTVRSNLAENLHRFGDIQKLYAQAIQIHKNKLLEYRDGDIYISVLKLKKSEPLDTIIFEIVKGYGFSAQQVKEVKKLLDAETGSYIISDTYRILRNRAWLIISPLVSGEQTIYTIEKEDSSVIFNNKILELSKIVGNNLPIDQPSHVALIDANEIDYPLILRKWKQGDYFYPLGMRKKKKLSRFFIDNKLSLTDKGNIWVLESHKRIVWVIGMRIDDRFKRTGNTNKLLKLSVRSI